MKCPRCGAEIQKGAVICKNCNLSLEDDTATLTSAPEIEKYKKEKVSAKGEKSLLILGPIDSGEEFELKEGLNIIGRENDVDIFLNDITVSRRHAEIKSKSNRVSIRDLDSLNGTYVNGKSIETSTLKDGDEIQIGRFKLLYHHKRGVK